MRHALVLLLVTAPFLSAQPAGWKEKRATILKNMQEAMGPMPGLSKMPLDIEVLEEQRTELYIQRKITFAAEPGDRVPAYLLIPLVGKNKHAAMLCLHQTTKIGKAEPAGLGGKPNLHYARELAERGYVALVPDYPNFGEYTYDPYAHGYASATMKGIVNHRRAVDLLASLPQVDATRIGVIGHSLGGHNALFVAAFDTRLRAAVTSCGFNSFHQYAGGNLKGWSHKGYMPRILELYHASPNEMPFDFPDVLAAIAPRAVFINAPLGDTNFPVSGVYVCVRAAKPVYEAFGVSGRLVAVHPDAGHDFPEAIRTQAYEFLDRTLRTGDNRR